LVAALIGLVSCHKASRDDKLNARDDTSFELWISDHKDVLEAQDIQELNTARQQIRYKVMQSHPGMMSEAFSDAVYAEIYGHTMQELLLTSYQLQIERMKTELLNYQPQLERFQAHQQNPNLNESQKKTVVESLEKLHRLMEEHQAELARLTKRLSELERGGK